jgi:hypothetical protein
MRQYHQMSEELYVIDNTVFRGKKMLIPKKLRAGILEGLHAAHQGVSSMKSNARERFFWLGLDADVKQKREQCRSCIENAPSQRDEPAILTPLPEMPFQQVAVDYYYAGNHHYLIYADRYSGWTEVALVPNTSFNVLKKNMIMWFRTYGVPEEISSDGGPPFQSSDYNEFLRCWKIEKRLSSAYYPQSNGRAEVAVKTMKRTLNENVNPRTGELSDSAARAIMTHRNTPSQETGISPAEILFGCKLRDHLPNKFRCIRKEWKEMHAAKEIASSNKDSKTNDNTKPLIPLKKGDSVSVQNQHGNKPGKWSNTGIIMEVHPNRQYGVMMDGSRQITLRNRKYLKPINPTMRKSPRCYSNLPTSLRTRSNASPPVADDVVAPGVTQVSTPPAVEDTTQMHAEVTDRPTTGSANPQATPERHAAPPQHSASEETCRTPANHGPATQRRPRALNNLQDHNKRGTTESPLQQSAMPATGGEQVTRRSRRAKKPPDRLINE